MPRQARCDHGNASLTSKGRWITRIVCIAALVVTAWVLITAWPVVVHGHPLYSVMLVVTAIAASVVLVLSLRRGSETPTAIVMAPAAGQPTTGVLFQPGARADAQAQIVAETTAFVAQVGATPGAQ